MTYQMAQMVLFGLILLFFLDFFILLFNSGFYFNFLDAFKFLIIS
jgi:hypothetical protein